MKIGVTGHQELPDASSWDWVRTRIDEFLQGQPSPLVALSSLAMGADQLFALRVLARGGVLHAVLPFHDYRSRFGSSDARQSFDDLLSKSSEITILDSEGTDEQRYWVAGQKVVELSDAVVAVWDGKPARGLGGTGDVVEYAIAQGVPVHHLDPSEHEIRRI